MISTDLALPVLEELRSRDPIANALTKSLVELSASLGLTVVMEGIETAEEEQAVTAIGGSLAQGYRYYKPMSARSIVELWNGGTALAA